MVSNWVTYVWAYVTGYTRWADAWTLFLSGILAAGITLPANGQPDRTWAFAILVILFNVAVNAIRRAKPTITASIGAKNMDPITTLVTAIEAAVTAFKATAVTPVQVTTFPETTVVSPNHNVTYPVVSPNLVSPPENASEAAARAAIAADVVADANESAAVAALTPAEAAVVAANTGTAV